jgi:hypothetical protein
LFKKGNFIDLTIKSIPGRKERCRPTTSIPTTTSKSFS